MKPNLIESTFETKLGTFCILWNREDGSFDHAFGTKHVTAAHLVSWVLYDANGVHVPIDDPDEFNELEAKAQQLIDSALARELATPEEF